MKNVLSNEQRAADLYRIAYECAEKKTQGCNGYCGNCPLNVSLYAEDAREAVLIKTTAAMDSERVNANQSSRQIFGWTIIGLLVWAICSIGSCVSSCSI
jgi:hypothetical protein